MCLPSAARLSRWINPPTQRRHLSSFCSQEVPIETLPRRGRCVCSFPKALSAHAGRHTANMRAACSAAVVRPLGARPQGAYISALVVRAEAVFNNYGIMGVVLLVSCSPRLSEIQVFFVVVVAFVPSRNSTNSQTTKE